MLTYNRTDHDNRTKAYITESAITDVILWFTISSAFTFGFIYILSNLDKFSTTL